MRLHKAFRLFFYKNRFLMNRIYMLLLASLSGVTTWAQSRTTVTEHQVQAADIGSDGYLYQRVKLEPGTSGVFTIKNTTTEAISPINDTAIKIAASYDVTASKGIERKVAYATLRIPVYVNEAGKLQKLVSYTLEAKIDKDKSTPLARPTDVTESVLASGNWYKIAIDKKGVYKIDHAMLVSMGLTPSSINPANIRIYGNGGTVLEEVVKDDYVSDLVENSIFVSSTGSTFGTGDYILFYANGPVDWKVNSAGTGFTHTQNYYEDKSYYFLNVDKGPGKRIETVAATGAADVTLTSFDDYAVIDIDSFNPGTQGKVWWSNRMSSSGTSTRTHDFVVNMGQLDGPVTMNTVTGGQLEGGAGAINVSVDGSSVAAMTINTLNVSGHQLIDIKSADATFTPSGENMNVKMTFSPSGSGSAYLDYFRFNARRKLVMGTTAQLSFRDIATEVLPETQNVAYQLSGVPSGSKVWEVTDNLNPVLLTGTASGSSYSIVRPGGKLREFIALNGTSYLSPSFVAKIDNQNLHGMEEIDFLIVTRAEYAAKAGELANFHRIKDGMKVAVVTVDKIYNEFSSGGQDIAGIRNFIKMFYDRATSETDMIKHVLFFGAASYDYKDRIAGNTNIVPVYQTLESGFGTSAYSSDDFYSLMDHNEKLGESSSKLDISVGRIPAATLEQATDVVNKITGYTQNTSFGPWKNNLMFLSDDYDAAGSHSADAESISNIIASTSPNYNHVKLYGDVYPMAITPSGKRMVAANKAMNDQIFLGTFLMNYSGHGGPTRLAAEDLLTIADINAWKNSNKLPVVVTATCDFGRFDNPGSISGGSLAFLKSDGGAIASITTTQLVFASSNLIFNTDYSEAQFTRKTDGNWRTLGEALRDGKNKRDGASNNNSKYTLLGDPALTLALPKYIVKTDSLLSLEGGVLAEMDSIKALGRYTLKGSIDDNDGSLIADFNGNVYVTIFDKAQTVPVDGVPRLPSYKSQTSIIYKGQATVENGQFSLSFVVPKDINFDFGKGKISYYADNGVVDAAGADTSIVVGGFSASAGNDNDAPIVEAFIDSDKFRDGGVTGPDPLLFVKLSDENGINVTGSAVGHDLVGILDGDVGNPFILNNYYQTEPNDFTRGTVSFPMAGIAPGRHTLRVKAWDTYNNSGEGEVNFEVVNKDEGAISEVYNYPNPFSENTTFVIQHNLSKQKLEVTIQIFNSGGSLINTLVRNIEPEGNRTEITWDGNSSQGFAMANGLYFYRVQIKSEAGVAATAYQKMVMVR